MVKVLPPDGQVSLADKVVPICEWDKPFHEHYAYTRGSIDIQGWKDKLRSLPADFWNDENQKDNVKLVRPAHDAWGIEKIIFTFCDDFLLKILDLPYSHQPEWRSLLEPVYQVLGIDHSRVVRCLLARMPPGVKIPVHHDTGFWVQHTHRCHVAIDTSDNVEFLVGPTADKMEPYAFDEGKVVELNNQAKHAVNNNTTDVHRVHLILDYVDEGYTLPSRQLLQSGDVVFQTRRSIDLEKEVRNYNPLEVTPRFIIIGSQKCGTTSMYEYLSQHPLVMKGKRRETHYFDWRFNHKIPLEDVNGHREFYMNFYEGDALRKHPSLVTGESTPSYLLHSDVVLPRLQKIVPWTHLIVMLRNPVDRAYSQYQMIQDPDGTPEQLKVRGRSHYVNKSFEDVMEDELKEIQAAGITAESTYEQFRDTLLKNRPMDHGGHSLLIRGLYALQLEPYFAHWPRNQLKVMSIKDIQGSVNDVRKVVNEVFEFIQLPPSEITDIEAKNTRKYEPISPEIRAKLEAFFAPHNERLFALLGKQLKW